MHAPLLEKYLTTFLSCFILLIQKNTFPGKKETGKVYRKMFRKALS
jgi:hypothetical protein